MTLVQVYLTSGVSEMVCWIPPVFKKKKIKEGMTIVLEDVLGLWVIEKLFDTTIEHYDIKRGWNNNI